MDQSEIKDDYNINKGRLTQQQDKLATNDLQYNRDEHEDLLHPSYTCLDMKVLSCARLGFEHLADCHTIGGRMKAWGKVGVFWLGGVWAEVHELSLVVEFGLKVADQINVDTAAQGS